MIGGTDAKHAINLKDPRDLDEAHRILWYGSGVHSATGFQGNGSNSYGDTNFNQLSHSELNNESFGFYSRTDVDGVYYDIGIQYSNHADHGNLSSTSITKYTNKRYSRVQDSTWKTPATADSLGFYCFSRSSGSEYVAQKNNVLDTFAQNSIVDLGNSNFYLGAANLNNSNAHGISTRELSYGFIGKGLTNAQMTAHYNAVQQLQIDLGRNV